MKRVIVFCLALLLWADLGTAQGTVLDRIHQLYASAQYDDATKELNAFSEGLDESLPTYPQVMARVSWQHAQILAAQSQFQDALKHANDSVTHAQQSPAQSDILTAIYQGERGKLLMNMGLVEAAYTDLQSARQGVAHIPALASIQMDMMRYEAMMHSELGQLSEASEMFSALVEDRRAQNDPAALATALMDLAGATLRENDAELQGVSTATRLAKEAENLISPTDANALGDVRLLQGQISLHASKLDLAKTRLDAAAGLFNDPIRVAHARLLAAHVETLRGDAIRAEQLFISAMKDIRHVLGPQHPMLARTLVGLGLVTSELGRPSEAISYLSQAVRVFEDGVGIGSAAAAEARVELAMIFNQVGDFSDARYVAETALETLADHQSNLRHAYANSALAFALAGDGAPHKAIEHFDIALRDIALQRGQDSSDLAPGLIRLAALKTRLGPTFQAEAERHLRDAWRILEKDSAVGPRLMAAARTAELELLVAVGQTELAAERARAAISFLQAGLNPDANACDLRLTEVRSRHALLVTALDTLLVTQAQSPQLVEELFEAAQIAHAGTATQAILARATHDAATSRPLLTERSALIAEKCALNRELLHGISGVSRGVRVNRAALEARLAALDDQIAHLTEKAGQAPGLLGPRPQTPTYDDVVAHLRAGESMLLQVSGDTGTHLFWLDASGLRHTRTDLTSRQLSERVRRLRASINIATVKPGAPLPAVPLDAAYTLYRDIFAPFAKELAATQTLFFVPDGATRTIPPSMLLTTDYGQTDVAEPRKLATLDWFGAQQAIAIVPSPASHIALRQQSDRPRGSIAFVGIGNPTFARARYQLPDTEKELNRLAALMSDDGASRLITGIDATETKIRTTDLVREARVLAFATHGLVNKELGVSEPALMLATPQQESAQDDGFLKASEIATLDLKADWVILSACNTAAGRDDRAEGLSGLATSFFDAGARSLLVSHWYVPSAAAGPTTVFMTEALVNTDVDRATALQHAMRRVRNGDALDGTNTDRFGHPAYWAPFVVVGDTD